MNLFPDRVPQTPTTTVKREGDNTTGGGTYRTYGPTEGPGEGRVIETDMLGNVVSDKPATGYSW